MRLAALTLAVVFAIAAVAVPTAASGRRAKACNRSVRQAHPPGELAGWRVICWAVLLSLPLTLPSGLIAALGSDLHADTDAWLGFAYVSSFSALFGFFPWYAGLARGGVAKIGQIQLLQPLLTLAWSAWLLSEEVNALTLIASIAVLASVVATQRTKSSQAVWLT